MVSRARLDAIDAVRGVIMILMALDHTRDFFGIPGPSPTNLAQATAPPFLTRWVTHFCAPVFSCFPVPVRGALFVDDQSATCPCSCSRAASG